MYKYKRRSDIESETVESIWIEVFPRIVNRSSFVLFIDPPPRPPTGLTILRKRLTMQHPVTI